jgi:hypothetical protein
MIQVQKFTSYRSEQIILFFHTLCRNLKIKIYKNANFTCDGRDM